MGFGGYLNGGQEVFIDGESAPAASISGTDTGHPRITTLQGNIIMIGKSSLKIAQARNISIMRRLKAWLSGRPQMLVRDYELVRNESLPGLLEVKFTIADNGNAAGNKERLEIAVTRQQGPHYITEAYSEDGARLWREERGGSFVPKRYYYDDKKNQLQRFNDYMGVIAGSKSASDNSQVQEGGQDSYFGEKEKNYINMTPEKFEALFGSMLDAAGPEAAERFLTALNKIRKLARPIWSFLPVNWQAYFVKRILVRYGFEVETVSNFGLRIHGIPATHVFNIVSLGGQSFIIDTFARIYEEGRDIGCVVIPESAAGDISIYNGLLFSIESRFTGGFKGFFPGFMRFIRAEEAASAILLSKDTLLMVTRGNAIIILDQGGISFLSLKGIKFIPMDKLPPIDELELKSMDNDHSTTLVFTTMVEEGRVKHFYSEQGRHIKRYFQRDGMYAGWLFYDRNGAPAKIVGDLGFIDWAIGTIPANMARNTTIEVEQSNGINEFGRELGRVAYGEDGLFIEARGEESFVRRVSTNPYFDDETRAGMIHEEAGDKTDANVSQKQGSEEPVKKIKSKRWPSITLKAVLGFLLAASVYAAFFWSEAIFYGMLDFIINFERSAPYLFIEKHRLALSLGALVVFLSLLSKVKNERAYEDARKDLAQKVNRQGIYIDSKEKAVYFNAFVNFRTKCRAIERALMVGTLLSAVVFMNSFLFLAAALTWAFSGSLIRGAWMFKAQKRNPYMNLRRLGWTSMIPFYGSFTPLISIGMGFWDFLAFAHNIDEAEEVQGQAASEESDLYVDEQGEIHDVGTEDAGDEEDGDSDDSGKKPWESDADGWKSPSSAVESPVVDEIRISFSAKTEDLNIKASSDAQAPGAEDIKALRKEMIEAFLKKDKARDFIWVTDSLVHKRNAEEFRDKSLAAYPMIRKYFDYYYNKLYTSHAEPENGIEVIWFRILGNHPLHDEGGYNKVRFTKDAIRALDKAMPLFNELHAKDRSLLYKIDGATFIAYTNYPDEIRSYASSMQGALKKKQAEAAIACAA